MLTLSMTNGEGFWLLRKGRVDERWALKEVFLSKGFVIEGPNGKEYEVGSKDHDEEVEIAPGVWLSDGHRQIVGRARVVLSAPQEVTILRDELYIARKKKEAA